MANNLILAISFGFKLNSNLKQRSELTDKKILLGVYNICMYLLGNKCLTRSVIYQATVETDEERQTYIGMTDTEFKTRYRNHKQSFERDRYEGQTELSKFIWSLKRSSIPFHISWEIVDRATSYSPITKRCNLCILEKYYILRHKERASLNKRSEL